MITRYLIPLIALIGFISAFSFTMTKGSPPTPVPNQLNVPPSAPFANTVSGTGIVEANSRNIEVGSHLAGIVAKVLVVEGQVVTSGTPLFQLDDRAAKAEVEQRQKDINVAAAQLKDFEVALADQKDQLKRVEGLTPGASVTVDRVQRQRFSSQRAQAQIALANAELESARAALHSAEITLERMTVHAPVAGRILKVRVREGEFVAPGNSTGQAPVLLGNDTPLHLRVSVDENDLWRLHPEAKAVAALRSNGEVRFPLQFVRVEPYVQPKTNLSGDTRERVDTRVLEVIYKMDAVPENPVYIGQQMDVFIEGADEKLPAKTE